MPDDDRPFNRRNFFREGLRHLLKPMQNMAAPLEDAIKQVSAWTTGGISDRIWP